MNGKVTKPPSELSFFLFYASPLFPWAPSPHIIIFFLICRFEPAPMILNICIIATGHTFCKHTPDTLLHQQFTHSAKAMQCI